MPSRQLPTGPYHPTVAYRAGDAAYWLDRAKEILAIADDIASPDARRMMLDLAKTYEVLADRAYKGAKPS